MPRITLSLLFLAIISFTFGCNSAPNFEKRDPFKYTVQTDIPNPDNKNVEILVAINSGNDEYPVNYDLDCDGDGTFEYKGLTENKTCVFAPNSGQHQISLRGDIPGLFLCERHTPNYVSNRFSPWTYLLIIPLVIDLVKDAFLVDKEYDVCDISNDKRCSFPTDMGDSARNAVVSVDSWGDVQWESMFGFAVGCKALHSIPEKNPDLKRVKDLSSMFDVESPFNKRFR